jgi:hypothetical protein
LLVAFDLVLVRRHTPVAASRTVLVSEAAPNARNVDCQPSGPCSAMNADRRMRLGTVVVELARGSPVTVDHVGAAVIAEASVDAVAVVLTLAATPRETVYASGPLATVLEDLAMTVGEGPSHDAVTAGPALVTDLTTAESAARWPVFAPAAVSAGVRAAFALPLWVGAIRLGVLDLYRAAPGALDGETLADVLVLADMACALLLDSAQPARPGGGDRLPERIALQHPEVHQATGMITVQLGVSAAVALIRLRAYAYAADRALRDVAGDVVARQLRFEPEPGEAGTDRLRS